MAVELDNTYLDRMEIAKVFRDNQKSITSLDFDDNGTICITASEDDSMHVYDVLHGKPKQLLYSKKYGVNLVRFTHRHTNVLHTSTLIEDNTIRYLSLHDNKYLQYFKGHKKRVVALAMNPRSDMFLSGSENDSITLWDLRNPIPSGIIDISGYPTLAFDPKGLVFALGLGSRFIRPYDIRQYQKGPFAIWNVDINQEYQSQGSSISDIQNNPEWTGLKFSTDSNHILVTTRSGIHYLIDSYDGHIVTVYHGHSNTKGLVLQADITPDSKYVYSGSEDGLVHFWDKLTSKEIQILEGHPNPVTNVLFNPKYMMMASACSQLAFWLPEL